MKFIYKILIIVLVFLGCLVLFSSDITRTIFSTSAPTTQMAESELPLVSLEVDGNEMNLLYGYSAAPDEMCVRESITPITNERAFTVYIDDKLGNVKKLKYEILNEDGRELENGSYTVLDVPEGRKKVKVSLEETMKSGAEYVCKLTLITSESKRIYYYTRLKMYDEGHLFEKLDFAQNFHNILISGNSEERDSLRKYLESSRASDNSTFAHVNIKSSYNMINWGDLNPTVVWQQVPTITDFYETMATVRIKSIVSIELNGSYEYYVVKEDFRMLYTSLRMYLYNYERTMESVFDVANTSLAKNEFKLGITQDTEAPTAISATGNDIAFVYGRELYAYDIESNLLTRVFSFRQSGDDYARDFYDAHDVKLIKVHDNGNIDFIVYGYMNCGEYAGRVGIVLYTYVKADNRIEEQLYMPINTSYQLLRADMTDFAYLNEKDVLYFSLYDCIYAYNMVTRELNVLADNVPEANMFFCEEEQYVVWQDNTSLTKAKSIVILDLESGKMTLKRAGEGESVRLYGRINNNIIYGVAKLDDIRILADGSCELPAYKLVISSPWGDNLKEYASENYYINGIDIGDNIIKLNRLKKIDANANIYAEAEPDSIMNRPQARTRAVEITKRITDRILTEYYVSLPSGSSIEKIPSYRIANNTIINFETTMRLLEPEDRTRLFYTYSFGDVIFASADAGKAVRAADEGVGTVINKNGRLIWERGVKASRTEISGMSGVSTITGYTPMQAAMKMLCEYKGLSTDTITFDSTKETVYDWLGENLNVTPIDLTGVTLDEALYSVYKLRPVISVLDNNEPCVITAYDQTGVSIWLPLSAKSLKLELEEAQARFEAGGSIFISFVN